MEMGSRRLLATGAAVGGSAKNGGKQQLSWAAQELTGPDGGTVGKGEMPGALDGREVESAGLVEEQCFATGLENLDGDWGGEEMGGGAWTALHPHFSPIHPPGGAGSSGVWRVSSATVVLTTGGRALNAGAGTWGGGALWWPGQVPDLYLVRWRQGTGGERGPSSNPIHPQAGQAAARARAGAALCCTVPRAPGSSASRAGPCKATGWGELRRPAAGGPTGWQSPTGVRRGGDAIRTVERYRERTHSRLAEAGGPTGILQRNKAAAAP
ncbi:hypothetical protein Purlil1_5513 [Purpureocillium lilacinum]|uniref:Uncharacterized protein n=1 Tax=Purpureocillium lilacinum TaxID=33203 RepID=A0ABR0C2C8_PURLI|nr:hypothetical protein Purlil1_5513 [Purpureocillium lilacinum]